jgi:hypothetical protein
VLHRDLGFLDKFLSRDVSEPHGMMWIGPAGTVTSLHHPQKIIFMPLGWWHRVRSLDFSVTITYTNFLWPNDSYKTYPAGED